MRAPVVGLAPLTEWGTLAPWATAIPAHHGAWDVTAGVSSAAGWAARARVGYGLTDHVFAGAEAWAKSGELGAIAGVGATW